MCGEFGEVTVIIGLVINFLAFVSLLLSFRDTMTYDKGNEVGYLLQASREYSIECVLQWVD